MEVLQCDKPEGVKRTSQYDNATLGLEYGEVLMLNQSIKELAVTNTINTTTHIPWRPHELDSDTCNHA